MRALEAVAERQRLERGIDEPISLITSHGVLWANYGSLRIGAAGAHVDVESPEELFEEIDGWVAFERNGGVERLLARDLDHIEQWRGRLRAEQALWEEAARRVFRDVEATTNLRWHWRVIVHEEPNSHDPELWLQTERSDCLLSTGEDTLGGAV